MRRQIHSVSTVTAGLALDKPTVSSLNPIAIGGAVNRNKCTFSSAWQQPHKEYTYFSGDTGIEVKEVADCSKKYLNTTVQTVVCISHFFIPNRFKFL